jgi:eukaryotic-like serine/threonine-protein kinase
MALRPGDKLGRYQLISPIGEGGMGEVWKARDTQLDRDVALKVSKDDFTARFDREARAIAAFNHPNICTLYDIGPNYLVMELIDGEQLKGPLAAEQAAAYAGLILDALDTAHRKGFTHRDLKPANILVTKQSLKVLDFGLAKQSTIALSESDETEAALTIQGQISGTLQYMSPEQLQGKEADARSDIFAFGCVLYEMLSGAKAFSGSTSASVIAAILEREPEPLKTTPALDRVIRKCLAKNPDARFQTALELKTALHWAMENAGVTAPRTMRTAWIGVAAALALIAAGGIYYWHLRSTGRTIDSVAVLPFVNANGAPDAAYLSDGITESLIGSLSQLPNLKVMSRGAVFRYQGKNTDPRTAGRELGVRAVLTGHVSLRGNELAVSAELVNVDDNSELWGEQYNNRNLNDALAVQKEIARQIVDKLRVRLTSQQETRIARHQTENAEAYQLYLKGRFYASKFDPVNLARGRDYLRQATSADPTYALAYDGLSYYYALLLDWFEPANEVGPKALESAQKALELDPDLVEGHVELAAAHMFYDFDWPSAEREYLRAMELNPKYAPAHEYYAWYLIEMGKRAEGLGEIRKAAQLDPLSSEIAYEEGWLLYQSRRYEDALKAVVRCVEIDPNQWMAYFVRGEAYGQLGKYPEAVAALKKSEEILGDNPSPPLAEEARILAVSGDHSAALRTRDRLLELSKKTQVSKYLIATVYAALGDRDQAFTRLDQAWDEHSFSLGFLKVEPALDPLRNDPRFKQLLEKMKLE